MSTDSSENSVHLIAHFTVNDADVYHQYEKGVFPILKSYGGRFITYDDQVTVLEGQRAEGRTVMVEFPSEEKLMAWWDSSEYVKLAKLRKASTITHSIFVVHTPH